MAATTLAGLTRVLRIPCLRRLLPLGPEAGNVGTLTMQMAMSSVSSSN